MSFGLNLLWFVFGGFAVMLGWFLAAGIMALTVVGIPFSIGCCRIALFSAWPFGRELVRAEIVGEKRIAGTAVLNLIWIVLAGLWLALGHALAGLCLCMMIIGIPWGIQHFKIARVCFAPLGKRVVTKDMARLAREQHAQRLIHGKGVRNRCRA